LQYKVEVDLTTNANDFRHQSGAYELVLFVGDALLQSSFSWKLNDNVQLSFHEDSVSDTDHLSLYSAKPEIIHQFRVDEKRPPTIVSLIFSGLTLLPLLILLILWLKIGFNLSGLPLGLSPLGFHISHAAAFALMYFYWKYLNMFQTMRYLALISIPLFLFGHRVLAMLAARREKQN
jgi:oligosaccharyltransferase complex subunit delta (ribophorin II)